MESDDSPEIPERGKTPDIPGFPSGAHAFTHTLIVIFSDSNKIRLN